MNNNQKEFLKFIIAIVCILFIVGIAIIGAKAIRTVETASNVAETAEVIVNKIEKYPTDKKIKSIGNYLNNASINLASTAKVVAENTESVKIGKMEIKFATGKIKEAT